MFYPGAGAPPRPPTPACLTRALPDRHPGPRGSQGKTMARRPGVERGASAGHGYDYGAEGPGVIGGTTGPVPQWGDSESTTRGVTRGAKPRSRGRQHRHTHRPPGPAGPAAAVTMGSRRAHVTTAPSSHRVPGCTAPWRRGGAWRRSTAPGRGRGSGSRRETRGYRRNGDFFQGRLPTGVPRVKTAGQSPPQADNAGFEEGGAGA